METMVECVLEEPDDFLKVRETLTRIGVASRKDKILYQSCHILHKQGRYFIVHFKELFALDGKPTNFSENDQARRNTIANLLAEWGLIRLINPEEISELVTNDIHIGESDRARLNIAMLEEKRLRKSNEGRSKNKNKIDKEFSKIFKDKK